MLILYCATLDFLENDATPKIKMPPIGQQDKRSLDSLEERLTETMNRPGNEDAAPFAF